LIFSIFLQHAAAAALLLLLSADSSIYGIGSFLTVPVLNDQNGWAFSYNLHE